jgi:hypothetical protein
MNADKRGKLFVFNQRLSALIGGQVISGLFPHPASVVRHSE